MNYTINDIDRLYDSFDYIDAYSQHTDLRVKADPESAVGGMWEEIGLLQLDFMLAQGLQSHHRLLDIGCGTLRAGRLFIDYLDVCNYFGIDISAEAIKYARGFVQRNGLVKKKPTLIADYDKQMLFDSLGEASFDYILAHSVFNHLPEAHIGQCLRNARLVMTPASTLFFTYLNAPMHTGKSHKDFYYQKPFFDKQADLYGYALKELSKEYRHPRGQKMLALTLR